MTDINGEVILCPCGKFNSISAIREALDSNNSSSVDELLEWISGALNERAFRETKVLTCGSHCKKRAQASFSVLNAIRDAVRPYLEAGKQIKDGSSPRKESNSTFDEAFPALNATSKDKNLVDVKSVADVATKNANVMVGRKKGVTSLVAPKGVISEANTTKPKRRIRPAIVTQTVWGQGNLVNLPSDSSDSFPALNRHSAVASKTSAIPTATAAVTPKKMPPAPAGTSPVAATPKKIVSVTKKETRDEIAACDQLQRLLDLYCTLIDSCLVPSSALELHLLIRLLTVSEVHTVNNNSEEPESPNFASILSSEDRCIFFAAASLRKLSGLLRGLGPVIFPDLVRCPPFCKHLPELTEEFTQLLQEQIVIRNVSISVDQTALLTLPFKEERDSRHNYRTREEQAVYKNREESRDAFLYQLRAFLNVKGTMVDAAQANRAIQKIRQSSRVVVNGLMDSNLSWFAEVFFDMLLQIGHVPIEETDTELLRIIDKEKLQKLHRRFSSKATSTERSTKTLVADPKREASSPTVAAQQHFPGHQEFFFLFIISADSYNFSMHLRAMLVAKLRELIGSTRNQETDKMVMDSRLLARFLGVLVFSPNWQSTRDSGKTLVASESSLDGLHQLLASGLSVVTLVEDSIKSKSLVLAISWVVELLKMARWDVRVMHSRLYWKLLSSLRHIQIRCTVHEQESLGSLQRSVLIRQCLETLFSESVGLTQAMKLQVAPIDLSSFTNNVTADSRSIDTIDVTAMAVSPGALLASNPHIEELAALISGLAQNDPFSLRSPGASRKLRPSVVSPSISSLHSPTNNIYKDAAVSDPIAAASLSANQGNLSDSFQLKLRDSFFHQHGELKNLCEFAAGLALKNVEAQLVQHCIQPLIPEDQSNEEQLPVLQKRVMVSCLSFLMTRMEEQISGTLATLAPPESNPAVLKMAVTLAVAHSRQAGEIMVTGAVTGEMKKLKSSIARNDRKRLFAKVVDELPPIDRTPASDSERRDHPSIVTTMIVNLIQDFDTLAERSEAVLSSLKSLNAELEDWSQNVDTTIPPERTLRPFFESILLLDDHTDAATCWALSESSASTEVRWAVLAEFAQLAMRLTSFSRYGLRNLNTRLSNDEFLYNLIQLGARAQNTESISSLLIQLIKTKTVRSLQIKNVVLNSGVNENDELSSNLLSFIEVT